MSNPFTNWTPAQVEARNAKTLSDKERLALRKRTVDAIGKLKQDDTLHLAARRTHRKDEIGFAVSEKELQKQLSNLLRLKEITFLSPIYGKKTRVVIGWPDYTFAINGRACAWEVKTGYNQTTEEQDFMLAKLAKEGWRTAIIRSVEQAFEFLNQTDNIKLKLC